MKAFLSPQGQGAPGDVPAPGGAAAEGPGQEDSPLHLQDVDFQPPCCLQQGTSNKAFAKLKSTVK